MRLIVRSIVACGVLIFSSFFLERSADAKAVLITVALNSDDIFWTQPQNINQLDLYFGIGGRAGSPNPQNRYTRLNLAAGPDEMVVEEEGSGRSWTIIRGSDAKSEVSASRFLWAAGYYVDQSYYLPQISVSKGSSLSVFRDVRLKRRDGLSEAGRWGWTSSPFVARREFNGLRVLMAFLNNNRIGEGYNKTLRLPGIPERRIFLVSDLRDTLGKTGRVSSTAGIASDYAAKGLIDKIDNGLIHFHNSSSGSSALDGVPVSDGKWIAGVLTQLSDEQIRQAFRAGGFTESEVGVYLTTFRSRIAELRNLTQARIP